MKIVLDVEFRWQRVGPHDGEPHVRVNDVPRVLQTRKFVSDFCASKTIGIQLEGECGWTEWETVRPGVVLV